MLRVKYWTIWFYFIVLNMRNNCAVTVGVEQVRDKKNKKTCTTKVVLPFVRRSKRKMSKFHMPTFDSMCCNKKR